MLTSLVIRDYAIVDRLALEFGPGFTVLTGETGAGKSILLDALGLVLGDRADAGVVRAGCERAQITATFDIAGLPAVASALEERGIDAGGECILSRTIGADGRSRAHVNGTPAPLGVLAEIGGMLVDIHGQQAHQHLMRAGSQRRLLDEFGGHGKELARCAEVAAAWRAVEARLAELAAAAGSDVGLLAARLRHDLEELRGVELAPDKLAALEREHRRSANLARLAEGARTALALLGDDETGAVDRLARAERELAGLARLDDRLGPLAGSVAEAAVALRETEGDLRRYLSDLEADPGQLERIERELARLHDLGRKHRCPPAGLAAVRDAIAARLGDLDSLEARVSEAQAERGRVLERWREAAQRLHACRARTAAKLGNGTTAALGRLGMPNARLEVAVVAAPQDAPSATGGDSVELLATTNPGQPLRPLARIASGGELSRMSLAIQMVASAADPVPTLVVDEVDAGIGGRVAEIVGRELRLLGERVQVLCVTHLPQVASLGRTHLHVDKEIHAGVTRTTVRPLDAPAREQEIARMLGGLRITAQTLAHAREMLSEQE